MTTTSLALPNTGRQKRNAHSRTATRFCEEANISADDQLDLASFIIAAQYLGADATTDQLSEVFMEMEEAGDESAQGAPKEIIKKLLHKVDENFGTDLTGTGDYPPTDEEKDGGDPNQEIFTTGPLGAFSDDIAWQEKNLAGMMGITQDDTNLVMARNLMAKTALTRQEIAEITGVSADVLKEYESDSYDTEEEYSDEEEEFSVTKTAVTTVKKTEATIAPQESMRRLDPGSNSNRPEAGGISISGREFGKALMLTREDIMALEELVSGGEEACTQRSADSLRLLIKLKEALALTRGHNKRTKTLAKLKLKKLNLQSMSSTSDVGSMEGVSSTSPPEKAVKFPAKFRVVVYPGALVKQEIELRSKEVAKIQIGTQVIVEEINGRRCRISSPASGWCSLYSSNNRVILQKEGTRSELMQKALHAERTRRTKIMILKSVTTLNDATVEKILEKCDWNLRRAIESFYVAKYKTKEYLQKKQPTEDSKKKKKGGWWKSWTTFSKTN